MTPLQQAAQALMDALGKTDFTCRLGEQLDACEKALDAELEQSAEPVLYQRRMKPDYGPNWTAWDECSEATFKQILTVPTLHDWTHQARALYLHPPQQETCTSDEWLANCPQSVRDLANKIKSDAQQAKPKTMGDVQEMCISALQRDKRAELIAQLNKYAAGDEFQRAIEQAADMLEADVSLINEGNKAQQAKQVPLTDRDIDAISVDYQGSYRMLRKFARAIEAHHGIGGQP